MAEEPPTVIEIPVSDVISVNLTPGPASAGAATAGPVVVITEAQRSMLESLLKKVFAALPALPYMVEVEVSRGLDGLPRVVLRLRQP
jgi:hypothetical protein